MPPFIECARARRRWIAPGQRQHGRAGACVGHSHAWRRATIRASVSERTQRGGCSDVCVPAGI
ncbi:hypothetical protein IWW55_000693 [Coemansia sp. RSA 2706]|nr:hypothetical protein IWW55_000693 [Coemansia sp. RSA 2706]